MLRNILLNIYFGGSVINGKYPTWDKLLKKKSQSSIFARLGNTVLKRLNEDLSATVNHFGFQCSQFFVRLRGFHWNFAGDISSMNGRHLVFNFLIWTPLDNTCSCYGHHVITGASTYRHLSLKLQFYHYAQKPRHFFNLFLLRKQNWNLTNAFLS